MNKFSFVKIVIVSVVVAVIANVLFGRFLSAKFSTLPLLNRWKLVNPQAPIVINTVRQERISDTGDAQEALSTVKSKLSLVVTLNKENVVQVVGGAINLTSDGWLLVSKQSVSTATPQSYIKIEGNDTPVAIERVVLDPATQFAFVKIASSNIGVAALGNSGQLQPAQKVVVVHNGFVSYQPHFMQSFVTVSQSDVFSSEFSSDVPGRTFGIQNNASLIPGEAVVAMNGDVVGVWDGKLLVSSDVIKNALANFINNSQKFVRPALGFAYKIVTPGESSLTKLPQGALLHGVMVGLPAQKAGLLEGDVITSLNGVSVASASSFEELLGNVKPGDQVSVKVWRKGVEQTFTIVPTELK